MIFVTLGTQDKPFDRLVKALEKQVIEGNIKEEVVIQAGCTTYQPKTEKIKIVDYVSSTEFEEKIEECNVLITHGGVGSIVAGLKHHKKVIAAARKKEYGEHVNNHQEQILDNFSHAGYILALEDFDKLEEVMKKLADFKPNAFKSHREIFVKEIEKQIENLLEV